MADSGSSPTHVSPPVPSASAHAAPEPREEARGMDRRGFLGTLSALGLGGGLFPGALWARAQAVEEITVEVVAEAEKLAGIKFSPEERSLMVESLRTNRGAYERMRESPPPWDLSPALHFDPQPPGRRLPSGPSTVRPGRPADLPDPDRDEELAFASLAQLGQLLRERRVTSDRLTRLYLDRLRRFGPRLECVVTLTEDLALEQARRADRELDQGLVRGPLHGIPWGAKDLLATRDYPTTWGAEPFRDQVLDVDATVVRRLEDAGAVLVAKLTLGALAMGDVWFGGRTRNPWNLEDGSSGSSAGSAAAVVAGLVGFAMGSETLGSIISPAVRCGATGLRPTFGRVSRYGAMALSWSMDKLGPLCRNAEDCALVLAAIQGTDELDRSVRDVPFQWDGEGGLEGIRVGVLAGAFEEEGSEGDRNREVLRVLEGIGIEFTEVELPDEFPLASLRIILSAEAAASFDELTRSGAVRELTRQDEGAWPTIFRVARMTPAVEYIQANRLRTRLVSLLDRAWEGVDVVVSPPYHSSLLLATNLTGHPAVILPHGFQEDGTPVGISFVGGLWKDAQALKVAQRYQEATEHHRRRPPPFV